MTTLLRDLFLKDHVTFELIGFNGPRLFDPHADLDIFTLNHDCSACDRGFQSTYALADRRLHVRHLQLYVNPEARPSKHPDVVFKDGLPIIRGIQPTHIEDAGETCCGDYFYTDVYIPVRYEGIILIGSSFIHETELLFFEPMWGFRTVHEFTFADGVLMHERDLSAAMALFREQVMARMHATDFNPPHEEIRAWIAAVFTLP